MKFGAREICDVVLKAKVDGQKIGNNVYRKGQPVMYFDSLKTSSIEQATTPVYAQGGKGNAKLVSWEGEKTITFVMEDALLSPISFAILTKASLTTGAENPMIVHKQGRFEIEGYYSSVSSEDKIDKIENIGTIKAIKLNDPTELDGIDVSKGCWMAPIAGDDFVRMVRFIQDKDNLAFLTIEAGDSFDFSTLDTTAEKQALLDKKVVFLDFYITSSDPDNTLIEIEPKTFEGNYYLEASTLFRTTDGVDLPAEFIIPNCKPQSAMTLALASTGDPSTFTFTMDAYPDYTVYDPTKKVLAAIQILDPREDEKLEDLGNGLTQF